MIPDDEYEKEKPSWRDIDRMKDRSRHVSKDRTEPRPKSPKKEWAQKMYLKEIANLFKGKKASKEHAIALREIHERTGTKKFNTAVKNYLKEYGLPEDWSTLFLLLDYKDTDVVRQAALALKELSGEVSLSLKEGLKSKLNIIAMTTSNEDLRDVAEEILREL